MRAQQEVDRLERELAAAAGSRRRVLTGKRDVALASLRQSRQRRAETWRLVAFALLVAALVALGVWA